MRGTRSRDSVEDIAKHPLQHLDYFMEWGGMAWKGLMNYALKNFLGLNLQGQVILDIGTRYGKMACLFGLLGGKVMGADLTRTPLSVAREESQKWNIHQKCLFVQGTGDLSIIKDNSFDVVFSKSVLVVVPNLSQFLKDVRAKLKTGGRIVFLENAKGPKWLHILRAFRHGKWDYKTAHYFTSDEIRLISEIFQEVSIKRWMFPPVVLILGRKLPNHDVPRV